MLHKILVANRGEIACRVIRTAKSLGYETVAVFSDADAEAPHVTMADEAVRIGPAEVGASYLSVDAILRAAARTGADAVHPGYGFLSENAGFAKACAEAGLVFIGPPPSAIDAMGDKSRAKALMIEAGVPTVPGFQDDGATDDALIAAAEGIGTPLLVKASAGGGGRGMRRIDDLAELPAALKSARSEALRSFGHDGLLLEKLVEGARHVEVQVFADTHGHTVHLGERDCSVQRRHQKVIEEAPCPVVGPELRERMGQAACEAAKAVGYVGAGTVEFLLDQDGSFYFLEMNTRLQVEHPVTEEITGTDLVAWQLQVAEGGPLPLSQQAITWKGHAMEARLYAEDPAQGYLPQTGELNRVAWPEGVRVDAGVTEGGAVTPYYDPMIAKIITWGPDRDTARRRLLRALRHTTILGVGTNRHQLMAILGDEVFAAGHATTAWLDQRIDLAEAPASHPDTPFVLAAAWWHHLGAGDGFRLSHHGPTPLPFVVDGERVMARVQSCMGDLAITLDGETKSVRWDDARVQVDGLWSPAHAAVAGESLLVAFGGTSHALHAWDAAPQAASQAGSGTVVSPMAAKVLDVAAQVGAQVHAGEPLLTVEAMKLQTILRADVDGTVQEVRVKTGDAVGSGQVLVVVQPHETTPAEPAKELA